MSVSVYSVSNKIQIYGPNFTFVATYLSIQISGAVSIGTTVRYAVIYYLAICIVLTSSFRGLIRQSVSLTQ